MLGSTDTFGVKLGERFGRWTVLDRAGLSKHGKRLLHVECDCGTEREVLSASLTSGRSQSCGCLKVDNLSKPAGTRYRDDPTYQSWHAMNRRCYDENFAAYPWYGGRGIKVCDQWRTSFENFRKDMGARPAGMTLQRLDRSAEYSPENCRWGTNEEQHANMASPWRPEMRPQLMAALRESARERHAEERGYPLPLTTIKWLREKGLPQREIAATVGVSQMTVSRALRAA